jgi:hypothetical protein
MSNFSTPMAQELEVYIEGQLSLVRSKMEGADPMEASDLWGQMKQLQKMKTWLHYWEGQTRKR